MEVKSYLIDEHADTVFANEEIDRWKELVDKLGLEQQKNLIKVGKSPLPFPMMSDAEKTIYRAVLETHESYKEYKREAIPVAALSLIALAEQEKYFDDIQIWFADQRKDDPIVVGRIYESESDRENEYTWNMTCYLIAAWGQKIKSVLSLLPIYEAYRKKEITDYHDAQMRNLNTEIERFKFQLSAMK